MRSVASKNDTAMTLQHTVRVMPPLDHAERRRLLIARAEYHERLAAQIRRLAELLADDSPLESQRPSGEWTPKLVR